MANVTDIFDLVNKAIDDAFINQKYQLDLYAYLKSEQFKRDQVLEYINSSLFLSIRHQIEEIDCYLSGDEQFKSFREAYNWMGKPRARKIKEYLEKLLSDAEDYEKSKRRGRKPGSTTKKKRSQTSNK